jgi:hypothetical protein
MLMGNLHFTYGFRSTARETLLSAHGCLQKGARFVELPLIQCGPAYSVLWLALDFCYWVKAKSPQNHDAKHPAKPVPGYFCPPPAANFSLRFHQGYPK